MSSDASLAILSKALQASVEKAVEAGASRVLIDVVGVALAGPAGAALAAAAKALVEAMLETTSTIERKIDALLDEPLGTALRMFENACSMPVQSPGARREQERLLTSASDQLEKAYTLAQKQRPEKLMLIRLYQTLVAAMRPDAHEIVDLFVAELRERIPPLLARARACHEIARSLEADVEDARLAIKFSPRVGAGAAENHAGAMMEYARIAGEQRDTAAQAAALEQSARELELFCEFALRLSRYRRSIE